MAFKVAAITLGVIVLVALSVVYANYAEHHGGLCMTGKIAHACNDWPHKTPLTIQLSKGRK